MGQQGIKGKLGGLWARLDKRMLLIILLIFLLAFCVRGHLIKWELFFEFDSYFHARIGSYVVKDFALPQSDPGAYYQEGGAPMPHTGIFLWYFCALIYKIFTLNAPYNKELWIMFVKFLPAIFGALISVAMYFLGKEMYGKEAGIAMGFFAALVPAFIYRTMAGFFEDDSLGFLWLILGFYFLVKALKNLELNRDALKNALISGIFFGIMALTWEMFLLIPLVLLSYAFWTIIMMWFKNQNRTKIFNFVKILLVAFILFAVIATAADGGRWIERSYTYVSQYLPLTQENIERARSKGEGVIAQTVGEENLGFNYFGEKYNALIIFPLIAVLLIPYRLYRKKDDHLSLIIFFWTIITFYMAYSKLKFTYTFGLPIAACGGFIFGEMFEFFEGRTDAEKKVLSVALLFMVLLAVGAGTYFVSEKIPNIEASPDWKAALEWMRENTPKDAKFFNWWDEGHWISFMGERRVITDNRNMSWQANAAIAQFVITEDLNHAYSLVKNYGSDYVILSDDLIMKQSSLVAYAYNTTDFSDPRFRKYFGVLFSCSRQIDPSSQAAFYECGANRFPEQQMISFPTEWMDRPNTQLDARIPGFLYRDGFSKIFVVNSETNNSTIMRLWIHEPEASRLFEEVYSNSSIKIFKVL